MKIHVSKFTLPDCALDDELPDKAFRLLAYLFSVSDFTGQCAPGYDEMMHHTQSTSRNTISRNMAILQKKGWFDYTRRRGHRTMRIHLRIPARYDVAEQTKKILSIKLVPRPSA